ncbi:MAG: aspartyl-tRNA synthetase [Mycoplasmataceae bacterium RC_NB112A]|nr:MAG: aspartyl-tRNA synthetase [Mycoplasmataceae bacterium RC_NB112A]
MSLLAQIAKLTLADIEKRVWLYLWINQIRHKKFASFLEGQDSSGEIQIVVKKEELISSLKLNVKRGDLLKVEGIIKKKQGIGEKVEINLENYQIINSSKELPFGSEEKINEDTRYHYRYLDLRRPASKKILLIKNEFIYQLRKFLHQQEFVEVETPILAHDSPEGAGSFLVPSNFPNYHYILPQSPQIYKQLLMVAGFSKYYQIAKSFRNEDARSNRQIEFSQLDLEMSFTSLKEMRELVEKMLKIVLKEVFGYDLKTPFPILTYQQALEKYHTDKPDLRSNLADQKERALSKGPCGVLINSVLSFGWITDWPLFEYNSESKKYESLRHPFTKPQPEFINLLLNDQIELEKVKGEAFDLVCNGEEILSGSLRINRRNLQAKILALLGYSSAEQEKHFGFFLQALEFAAPPHGGFGMGIDRLLAVILKVKNLKELVAFPKNVDGLDPLIKKKN